MRHSSQQVLLALCSISYSSLTVLSAPIPPDPSAIALPASALLLSAASTAIGGVGLVKATQIASNTLPSQTAADQGSLQAAVAAAQEKVSQSGKEHAEKFHPDGEMYLDKNGDPVPHGETKAAQHHAWLAHQAITTQQASDAVGLMQLPSQQIIANNPGTVAVTGSNAEAIIQVAKATAAKQLGLPPGQGQAADVAKLAKVQAREQGRATLASSVIDTVKAAVGAGPDRSTTSTPEQLAASKPAGCTFDCPNLPHDVVAAANRGEDLTHLVDPKTGKKRDVKGKGPEQAPAPGSGSASGAAGPRKPLSRQNSVTSSESEPAPPSQGISRRGTTGENIAMVPVTAKPAAPETKIPKLSTNFQTKPPVVPAGGSTSSGRKSKKGGK